MKIRFIKMSVLSVLCLSFAAQADITEAINSIDEALKLVKGPKVTYFLVEAKKQLVEPLAQDIRRAVEAAENNHYKSTKESYASHGANIATGFAKGSFENLAAAAEYYKVLEKTDPTNKYLNSYKDKIVTAYNNITKELLSMGIDLSGSKEAKTIESLINK